MICPAKFPDEECDEPSCQTGGCIINALCNESRQPFIKTLVHKICPNSGKSCDCPKGICQHRLASSLDAMDELYPSVANEIISEPKIYHVCVTLDEQSSIDLQEALSLKYALCMQILMLSSGKFALFGPYSMDNGIPLIVIDTWENLEQRVRAYHKTAEDGYAQEKSDEKQQHKSTAKAAADYDSLFDED